MSMAIVPLIGSLSSSDEQAYVGHPLWPIRRNAGDVWLGRTFYSGVSGASITVLPTRLYSTACETPLLGKSTTRRTIQK
jgi:hypothetical protein